MKKSLIVCLVGASFAMSLSGVAKTKLVIMSPYGAGSYQEAWVSVAQKYMKVHPEVQVTVIPSNWGLVDKITVAAAAGTGPDLAILSESYVGKLGWRGLIENLEPYIKNSKFPVADYYQAPMDAYRTRYKTLRGQFGMPVFYSGYGFYYNKDTFAKRGLVHPESDWTMDQFKEYVVKLTLDTNNDGKTDQWALEIQNHQNRLIGFIRGFGGDIIDEEKDEFRLGAPESIAGLQFFGDLWAKYHAVGGTFASGSSAMCMGSAFEISNMRTSKFDFDVAAFPVGPKGLRSVAMPTAGIAMLKLCKNKPVAWSFIQYLVSRDIQDHLARLQLSIPVNIVASKAFFSPDQKPKNGEVFLESVRYARPAGTAPYIDDVFALLTSASGGLLSGRTDAAGVVRTVAPAMATILKLYKARMTR